MLGNEAFKEAYNKANAAKKKITGGKGLTQQSFGIFKKVKEVDQLLTSPGSPNLRERVIETHPELIFWAMNGGKAMSDSKKKAPGRKQRLDLLAKKEHFPRIGEIIHQYCKPIQEDILDAHACLWAAIQYRRGKYQPVPDRPPDDSQKLPMRMIYPVSDQGG